MYCKAPVLNPGVQRPRTECLWFQFLKAIQFPGTHKAENDQLQVQDEK